MESTQTAGAQPPQPLAGFTVGVTAARRAEELGALLERRGAAVRYAPAMRTVPLADDGELRTATEELLARPPDAVVANTAVGFRGWLEAATGWGLGDALLACLGAARLLTRGPKVRGAVRAAGLREEWSPASESLAEVQERLLDEGVAGLRVAVQLHGEPLAEFVAALRAAGAEVVPVRVYRWLPPEDPGPLDGLIDAALAHGVDALTFTSAPAAVSLLARAERRGLAGELVAALRAEVAVACVGPVTAAPLAARGVPVHQPERFRLAPLVQLLCAVLPERAAAGALTVAGRRVEPRGHALVVDGELRELPVEAVALLRELARRPGREVPRGELVRAVPAGALEPAAAALRDALGGPGALAAGAGQDGGYRLAAGPGAG